MSAASPVLVVTRLDDATADVVVEELGRRSVPVVRLDPGHFPATTTVAARAEGPRLTGEVRTGTRSVALDAVRSVYWRRPRPYSAPDGLKGPDADWCAQQAHHGLGGILTALPGAHYVTTRGATGLPSTSRLSTLPPRGAGCTYHRHCSPTMWSGHGSSSVITARPSTSRCTTANTSARTARA
ncbi:MvdC/MvdD family ATP grasp protein [Streptomyces sp. BBFR51]|uniref:MvdC/MvdD family ATP grasp protein n=1 Tax=Streptomyces sp. BBFR51 TaxID=3372856 RepID=UPI0037DD69F2